MNTSSNTVDCYEVTEKGIRAVRATPGFATINSLYFKTLADARAAFMLTYREQNPRVAPRMSVASPVVAAA